MFSRPTGARCGGGRAAGGGRSAGLWGEGTSGGGELLAGDVTLDAAGDAPTADDEATHDRRQDGHVQGGGIAEQPDVAELRSSASSSHNFTLYILGAGVAFILVATGAAVAVRRARCQ